MRAATYARMRFKSAVRSGGPREGELLWAAEALAEVPTPVAKECEGNGLVAHRDTFWPSELP